MYQPVLTPQPVVDAPESEYVLTATGVSKAYGPTHALRDAHLRLRRGEVHALLGENGAGKSTLVKSLVGAEFPDLGHLHYLGKPLYLQGVTDAVRRGIVPVYQHLTLFPDLTIAENLVAFDLAGGSGWRRNNLRFSDEELEAVLQQVGLTKSPRAEVGHLTLADRQLVEIARGLMQECRVLILDEPTAALNHTEAQHLFRVIGDLRDSGRSVLFISHRLPEVEQICDTVTVLRNGRTVLDAEPVSGTKAKQLVEAMAGTWHAPAAPPTAQDSDTIVEGRQLACGDILKGIDLSIKEGEILGVVGLMGSGALELGEAIAGTRRLRGGTVEVGGARVRPGSRWSALRRGVALIPSDRDTDGTFSNRSVQDNAGASTLRQAPLYPFYTKRGDLRRLIPWLNRVQVHPQDPAVAVRSLSGGNQQKVLVARCLAMRGTKLIVALEPTRGVDIAARQQIHEALADAARSGVAVMIGSTDLDEVAAMSHRVLVMQGGRVVAELPQGSDPGQMLELMTGEPE